jgi:hypothetical protein
MGAASMPEMSGVKGLIRTCTQCKRVSQLNCPNLFVSLDRTIPPDETALVLDFFDQIG